MRNSSFLVVAICFLLSSCGGNRPNGAEEVVSDTLIVEEETKVKPYPATQFPSVEALKYEVNVFDSLHSGIIENLKDMYADAPGVFTFRGNLLRNADFGGRVKGRYADCELDFRYRIG